jgi:2-polyprenyl-3-methyl-5-hydroxy-6-metoxy-1,4-benzoquinol methylase
VQDGNGFLPEVINAYLELLTTQLLPKIDYANISILDVGARAFESWDYFLKKYDCKIEGIDIGKAGLDYCKEHNKTGMAEVDAHKMQDYFPPEQFDLIVSFHAFEHMYDLPLVLQNCAQVLKPGGHVFFALPMPSINFKRGHWYDVRTKQAMLKMCTDAGLGDVIFDEIVDDKQYRPEQEMIALVKKQ